MYNGIGLQTTRGSGTNGYVVKNLSAIRHRDGPPGGFGSGANNFGALDDFPKHRQPDQGILDHEKKRQVEVRCAELTDELEEKGFPEDEIEEQVSALRAKLLALLPTSGPRDPKTLKQSQTHDLAEAKANELTRMRSAFNLNPSYKEGAAFDREEQERLRAIKRAEYEEKDRLRAERQAETMKVEEERKEAEKKRRRDEERARKAAEKEAVRRPPPRQRSPSPPPRPSRRAIDSRSPSPRRSRSPLPPRDRSISPPPPRGRRRSSTPPRRRRASSSSSGYDSDDSRRRPVAAKRATVAM